MRHGLGPGDSATGVEDAATRMVGLHSSDPATVFLSVWARVPRVTQEDIEAALYEDRSIVRLLGMRRTLWVVPTEFAPLVNSSSTVALRDRERTKAEQMIGSAGFDDPGGWIDRVSELTYSAIAERGEALARQLTEDIPELREKITYYRKDGSVLGTVGMSTRILFLLSAQGRVIRGRPAGSWISSQYRWSTTEHWLGGELTDPPAEVARARVVEAWLKRFGPASEMDVKWWTGWPMGQVRRALVAIGAVGVELESGPGLVHPDDVEPITSPGPWVALLPSLDPTTMGWRERSWYLGDHYPVLFDRNGNAGPTVWVDGRIVGGWAQRKDGRLVYELFEDVGTEATTAVEDRMEQLQEWLGDVVVTPRFRSPHDKQLTAGVS